MLKRNIKDGGPSSHPVVNGTAAKPTQNGTAEPLPASIAGFDDIINGSLASFKELSGKIGTEVKTIVRAIVGLDSARIISDLLTVYSLYFRSILSRRCSN